MKESHTINGITKTFLEWCEEYNRNPVIIRSRMSMGHSLEDSLHMHGSHKDKLVRIGNETYTFQHWCRIYSISVTTVRKRVKKGFSIEEALMKPVKESSTIKYYTVNGQRKSIVELSSEYNINQSTLTARLISGNTIEEALDLVPKDRRYSKSQDYKTDKLKLYNHNGETKTLLGWCEHLGLKIATVQHRMYNGFSFEEAIDISRFPVVATYDVHGEQLTISQISEKYGVDREYLSRMMLKQKLPVEEAIKHKEPTRKKLYFTIDGERMSITQIMDKYGLKNRYITELVNKGLTIEKAIAYALEIQSDEKVYYEFEGELLNLNQISKRTGICRETLDWRITKSGMSLEEALKPRKLQTFLVDGKQMTVREISQKYEIPIGTIRTRLRRGLSIEEAIHLG